MGFVAYHVVGFPGHANSGSESFGFYNTNQEAVVVDALVDHLKLLPLREIDWVGDGYAAPIIVDFFELEPMPIIASHQNV
jgi:hypothetical protein